MVRTGIGLVITGFFIWAWSVISFEPDWMQRSFQRQRKLGVTEAELRASRRWWDRLLAVPRVVGVGVAVAGICLVVAGAMVE